MLTSYNCASLETVRNFSFRGREEADGEGDPSIFDVDTAVCVVDLKHLGLTAKTLTGDPSNAFLRRRQAIIRFGLTSWTKPAARSSEGLNGDVSTPFWGDGS